MTADAWRKSPDDLQERFGAVVAGIAGMERRQMFGYPAAFVGGHLTTSLFRDSWIVRLPEDERQACLDAGGSTFEAMPGRPMREYVALPAHVAADAEQAGAYVERAATYVRTLRPKQPKKARRPSR